jgi:broad-specificity NMP kinase
MLSIPEEKLEEAYRYSSCTFKAETKSLVTRSDRGQKSMSVKFDHLVDFHEVSTLSTIIDFHARHQG